MKMQTPSSGQQETVTATRSWPPPQGEWTYEDWLKLPDDGYRYEVIDGVLYMSPPPLTRHQRVSMRMIDRLLEFLRTQPLGEILAAPVGVRLPNQPVPLQPDIVFIRTERLGIIDEAYIEGTPDLLMEILSPSNWLYDRREKMQVYQAAGVTEYWIIDPRALTIEVYVLEQTSYMLTGQYGPGEVAPSRLLRGFAVSVADIFSS
jgi:Uma2 family endonuclease